MIWVTKLDGTPLLLNDDQILFVEVLHDVLITLANGSTLRVLESADELTERIGLWRRRVLGLAMVPVDELNELETG
jgi:uncharacterized protein YlzI (FlbEa/FlbD family)